MSLTTSDYLLTSGTVYHEFANLTPFSKIREEFPDEFKLESELKDDPDVMRLWDEWRGDKDEEHWFEFLEEHYEEFEGYYHEVDKSGSFEYDCIIIWRTHQRKMNEKKEEDYQKYFVECMGFLCKINKLEAEVEYLKEENEELLKCNKGLAEQVPNQSLSTFEADTRASAIRGKVNTNWIREMIQHKEDDYTHNKNNEEDKSYWIDYEFTYEDWAMEQFAGIIMCHINNIPSLGGVFNMSFWDEDLNSQISEEWDTQMDEGNITVEKC